MSAPPERRPRDLARLLIRAERLLSRRVATVLADHGCSLEAWRVLALLADGTGHFMTEIAEQVFLPPATLTKLVDQLVDDNLVHRKADTVDRRRIRAFLTPRGRALAERIGTALDTDLGRLSISDGDLQLLGDLLGDAADALTGVRATAVVAPA